MASLEAQKMIAFYNNWTQQLSQGLTLPTIRKLMNTWGDLTAEPKKVEFSDRLVAGVECILATPENARPAEAIILCLHGGGFMTGSAESHRKLYGHISKAIGCEALILDYSLAPRNRHPGIITEIVGVYAAVLKDGYSPEHVAMIGDSAGGGMSITSVLFAQELGYPRPAACVALSPWFDMECKGDSMKANAKKDVLVSKDLLVLMAANHLGEKSPKGPLANPFYADVRNLPPVLLQAGGDETLLDDSTRFQKYAIKAGVEVKLEVFPEMQHVHQMMAGHAPEADDAVMKIAAWLAPKMGIR
jgi:epsilon-lactone hydrolase